MMLENISVFFFYYPQNIEIWNEKLWLHSSFQEMNHKQIGRNFLFLSSKNVQSDET